MGEKLVLSGKSKNKFRKKEITNELGPKTFMETQDMPSRLASRENLHRDNPTGKNLGEGLQNHREDTKRELLSCARRKGKAGEKEN